MRSWTLTLSEPREARQRPPAADAESSVAPLGGQLSGGVSRSDDQQEPQHKHQKKEPKKNKNFLVFGCPKPKGRALKVQSTGERFQQTPFRHPSALKKEKVEELQGPPTD
jgi:hypothetical protein